jgi:hypothetical protein
LVTASSGGHSSASWLRSLQGGDNFTPTSHSERWLRPALPSAARLPTDKLQIQLSILNWLLESESESQLQYDWRLISNQFVLALNTSSSWPEIFFATEPLQASSYVTSSLTRGLVCLLWISFDFVKCTYRTYSMLLEIRPFALCTSPLLVQDLQSR